MARQYEYRARDLNGQLFTGLVLADDEASAAGHVRNKGLYVTLWADPQKKYQATLWRIDPDTDPQALIQGKL